MWTVFVAFWGVFGAVRGDFRHTPALGSQENSRCYDTFGRAQKCIPPFENAAYNLDVDSTNTCGDPEPQVYCVQTAGLTGVRKSCETCFPGEHHPKYMTDVHNIENLTWWQSETMLEGVSQVNLTLRFGKAFDITYVRLWFYSPRPGSFYISKKTSETADWVPYQYYSATCRDTYGLPDSTHTIRGEENRAFCTSEYSDISPLRGGNVAFGTLEGRPSAYNFDSSPELQEWVTATDIMITLDAINTFGDEIFGDPRVLQSYFYAIADVAVGARCKCNGHASECVASSALDGTRRRVCRCEHNTAGTECGECLAFFNDAPWARANLTHANECKQCNCNGYSERCTFDQDLFQKTGHGGHCLDCAANRDGPNCERCRPNYFMQDNSYCAPCHCDATGSLFQQCNAAGKCQCRPGITGNKCDRCQENFYDFTSAGCKTCACNPPGSVWNTPKCDPESGVCRCKGNVEGRQCKQCKPGFFSLDPRNEFGCTPCFCYGHSSQCRSAPGYFGYLIESTFAKGAEKWSAQDELGVPHQVKYEAISQSIGVKSDGDEAVYFVAPERFLGDQRASYNQLLDFSLRIGDSIRPVPSATDIILESGSTSITNTIFAQNNSLPTEETRNYRFRLHEHPDYGWQPRMSSRSFISVLTNLTAIKVKGTYAPGGVGFLDDLKLETAVRGVAGEPALWIELCDCPTGYVGRYCESCAPGYRHDPPMGGPFTKCIPCDCNGHASICDSDTGRCICQHNTDGENCEFCARGFYGNALAGTPADCQQCDCPAGGPCVQLDDDVTMCTECPQGYSGSKCELCSDGYFGDPRGRFGVPSKCLACDCNGNVDPNAIGNCNTTSGECLRCIYNTGGGRCEVCLPGFFGNALVLPKGDCRKCQCHAPGTLEDADREPRCDQTTGACACKDHVIGTRCDQCEAGFFKLHGGEGCLTCNCDPIGSFNQSCDLATGQCFCRGGVTGLRCDHCEARQFGFSLEGCRGCDCDVIGSRDLQCDPSGQCPCLDNVEGRKCDRCTENTYDRKRGCVACPDCYNLVQDTYRNHSRKLDSLSNILNEVEQQPTVIDDEAFPDELDKLDKDIDSFLDQVKAATGANSIFDQVPKIQARQKDVARTLEAISENIQNTQEDTRKAGQNLDYSEDLLMELEEQLVQVEESFEKDGERALQEARGRSKVAGQHSETMTKIAKEAREVADSLDELAQQIVLKSKLAKNESIAAYETLKKTHGMQLNVSEEARKLKAQTLQAELKLNRTSEWTKQVSEEAGQAKNDALALLNDVNNLVVPQLDVRSLKSEASALTDEAYRLSNKSSEVIQSASEVRRSVEEKHAQGKGLLDEALEQQESIENFKNDVDFCEAQAQQAVGLWGEILGRAESDYQILTEFDSKTQASKSRAHQALQTIPELQQIIQTTTGQMEEADATLADAQLSADQALKKAVEADQLAKDASAQTLKIKQEAELLRRNTSFLTDEAGFMFDRVLNTEAELKSLVNKARSNGTLVQEAKEKVGRAGKDTNSAQSRVSALLNDVESIIFELQHTPDIDEEALTRLEHEILEAEEKLKETRMEERLEELQRQHKFQSELIQSYKEQIKVLEGDVDNIEQIVNSLPDDYECFRNVELEP